MKDNFDNFDRFGVLLTGLILLGLGIFLIPNPESILFGIFLIIISILFFITFIKYRKVKDE